MKQIDCRHRYRRGKNEQTSLARLANKIRQKVGKNMMKGGLKEEKESDRPGNAQISDLLQYLLYPIIQITLCILISRVRI